MPTFSPADLGISRHRIWQAVAKQQYEPLGKRFSAFLHLKSCIVLPREKWGVGMGGKSHRAACSQTGESAEKSSSRVLKFELIRWGDNISREQIPAAGVTLAHLSPRGRWVFAPAKRSTRLPLNCPAVSRSQFAALGAALYGSIAD